MLTSTVGRIVIGEFSPRRNPIVGYNPKALVDELTQWESQLPHELRRASVDQSLSAAFWACMLYAFYKYSLTSSFAYRHLILCLVTVKYFCVDPILESPCPKRRAKGT